MKSLIIVATAIASIGMAAPAFAQTTTAEPTLTNPQGYLNLGYTYLNPYGHDLGEVFGRGGYGETPIEVRSDVGPSGSNANRSITVANWNYGAGLQYTMNRKDGLRFDYTRRDFQYKGADNPKDMDTYSVAFVHKF